MDTKYLDIIKAPVITEKSNDLTSKNQYVFKAASKANKTEIKLAIEKIFKVHVKEIRTLNVKPKKRRVGRYTGLTNKWKKVIVTLAEGEQINLS
ncbi:MAG TPA: 50S ribosomal protein L23 [Candidatus Onthousia faecavium]|nr:50S ribosomal protein L23 [Candidatus Onthousia faecavium]